MKKIKDFFRKNNDSHMNKKKEARPSLAEEDFIRDSKAALGARTSRKTHFILYAIILLILLGLIWAYFATIEQVTVGMGKVIPSSQIKIIQSLDGGIVKEIDVKEGQIVKKDQMLLTLDDTRYKSDFQATHAKYIALAAMIARLNAEAQQKSTIDFPAEVKKHPEVIARENRLFELRKKSLEEELKLLQNSYEMANRQVKMYEALVPQGYASRLDYYNSIQRATDIQSKIAEKRNRFSEGIKTDLTKNEGELTSLLEVLHSLRDKMIRTTLYSPVYGVVKKINIYTLGGVVSPGMDIMEIVPLSDTLLIETRVRPQDIAFLIVGQPATVKITAYDFSIYGGLKGVVEYISADTVQVDTDAKNKESFYLVNVRTNRNYLGTEKRKLLIMPGMLATVHIETGKKTVLQYLLKPLIKAKEEALRER
ncbi:MAG: HlyD family type I secretion periplasmic adaptor subunit [Gammaproteobacteria bacterium]|nr:HlyD family type I secretion periplasmic adaptor subunit [Gammaproteobacteria bacterium]